METRSAVGNAEAFFIQTRCTGAFFSWTWPEDTVLCVYLFIGNTPVVRLRSFCTETQFVEDFTRRMEVEKFFLAQAPGQLTDNLPVHARLTRRIDGLVIFDHSPFQTGYCALILRPDTAWQDDISQFGSLREEKVRHHEKI